MTDLEPAERLRRMVTAIAEHQAAAPERFRLLIRSEAELPEPLSNEYDRGRRQVLKEFVKVLQGGIDAGAFRPMDPRGRRARHHRHDQLDGLVVASRSRGPRANSFSRSAVR